MASNGAMDHDGPTATESAEERVTITSALLIAVVVLGIISLYGVTALAWWNVRKLRARRRRGFVLGGRRYFPVGDSDMWIEEDADNG